MANANVEKGLIQNQQAVNPAALLVSEAAPKIIDDVEVNIDLGVEQNVNLSAA